MTIAAGSTILAADVQAIKDDVDAIRSATAAAVNTAETTSSTSFTDLATSGPEVTLTTGTKALIIIAAQLSNDTAGSFCAAAVDISGATTSAAGDTRRLMYESSSANDVLASSWVYVVSGLTAGSNTFTLKYRVNGGTGTFSNRVLSIIPIGD